MLHSCADLFSFDETCSQQKGMQSNVNVLPAPGLRSSILSTVDFYDYQGSSARQQLVGNVGGRSAALGLPVAGISPLASLSK